MTVDKDGMNMSVETLKAYVQKNHLHKKRKYKDIDEIHIREKEQPRPSMKRKTTGHRDGLWFGPWTLETALEKY
ncbi:uncharacterized protein N7483_012381 [Penicillium malachiteum]|uniref:uncharacterized protein n=1 Tax=Penicillium malachiteum TaxID=1324776 RepID=UPI0025477D3B|nr:uncharacterized protein N7483_012381 [Penicillium malachiteum]KAJ5715200.1 hypothetical protein N7483_012381 [Penicillium malachiteum]